MEYPDNYITIIRYVVSKVAAVEGRLCIVMKVISLWGCISQTSGLGI